MKRPLFAPPDPFSRTPLLTVLPRVGDAQRLPSLTSSLYARYEKVVGLQREIAREAEPEVVRRINAEEAMLRAVLSWLGAAPAEGKGSDD